jgi:hypothetical protein
MPSGSVQPSLIDTCEGFSASFHVVAVNAGGFQWQHAGVDLVNGPNASCSGAGVQGATTSTLALSNLGACDAGEYTCTILGLSGCSSTVAYMGQLLVFAPFSDPVPVARPGYFLNICVGQSTMLCTLGPYPLWYSGSCRGTFVGSSECISVSPSVTTTYFVESNGVPGGDGPCRSRGCGSVTVTVNSSDFNGDGDFGTDADIEAFFACLAGSCCPTCGSADFNADGDIGTDADIEAFFRVLAGGTC